MNRIIEKIKNDKIINLIREYADGEIYLVGGVLRDFYLDKENFDKDIALKHNPEKFAKLLADALDATFIELDGEYEIYRVVLPDKTNYIDVAKMLGKNIEEDLQRRDLTINSIALNLKTFEIIDVTGGVDDLKNKIIRHISEKNFTDDSLRLLRVYRFEAMLGFEINKETSELVKKHAKKIHHSAAERVNYELLKLFSGTYSEKALLDMDKAGLLKEILPVSEDLKSVPPNLHHHLDLFLHSIEIVKQIQQIYENNTPEVKSHLEKTDFGGITRLAHLKFAGFLHDIGKPSTWTIEPDTGKHRFIKHDDVGSKMGVNVLKKLKLSKKQIDYITKMIKYHIYPSHVVVAPDITDKIYMRLIRKLENDVIDVIILAMADRYSARGVEISEEIVQTNINNLQKLLDFYLYVKDSLKPLPKLLSGEEIMEILDLKPSKELGNIIAELKEAQISGDINTKKEALIFIKSLKKSQNCRQYT